MEHIADRVYSSIYSKHWKALVLRDDFGRGEGPLRTGPNGEERPSGEYHLVVVTRTLDPLIRQTLLRMGDPLSKEFGIPVHLSPCLARSLKHGEFSLLNYELKRGHRVIRGDQNILSTLPDYDPGQIPLSEGTRLLMNRGKRLLDIKIRLGIGTPLTKEEHRLFLQSIFAANLAFGDCILLMRGAYDSSYAVRKNRIGKIDLSNLHNGRDVAEACRRAIEFKERADFHFLETENLHVLFNETVRRFEEVFLWYERRRLNRKFQTLEKYAHEFPNLGDEGRALSNAVHNLRAFGLGAFPNLFTHPRIRLYAALPLLLTPHANWKAVREVLRSGQSTTKGLYKNFESLQQQFS